MQAQVVLIVDSRKEMSYKYKKIIQQDYFVHPVISNTVTDASEQVCNLEPDLIIIYDNFEESIAELCSNFRCLNNDYRPVIVILSKSNFIDDKLDALRAGADDFLSEPIDTSEFSVRIFAHLRRRIEELSNKITRLPKSDISYKVLKRTIVTEDKWAMLYIDIDNFEAYNEIYGYLATDNLLKTFSAILRSAVDNNDFLGHIKNNSFIILTTQQKADKVASYINYAFDSISNKFYNSKDSKRGYLILSGDEKAGRRIPLVSTSIGIVSNAFKTFNTYQEAINGVLSIHKLAKCQPGSSWLSDRPKISLGDCSLCNQTAPKKILIVESDAAMAYLLTTTLEMQGYKTEATSNFNEIIEIIKNNRPNLILIDASDKNTEIAFEICRKIKSEASFSKIKIILSTIIHDKEKVLDTGADLYLPKPYELVSLFGWLSKFLDNNYSQ